MFAGTPDAPEIVHRSWPRAADGLVHNAPYPVKLLHAYHLHRAGATPEAAKIVDAIVAANRTSLLAGCRLVDGVHAERRHARAPGGDDGGARRARPRLRRGWRDGRTLAIDPFFASVRAEPRFKQLLSRIEADVAAMRARADYSGLP